MMNHVRRYGNYQLIREIGKGGYGEVFLVEDITTKKQYAMKMLDKDKIAKESGEDDVGAEVRSMKIVHHPFIVRLFEVLKTNKKILLGMEYMNGGDGFDAIKAEKNNYMSEEKARGYFQQIILSVNYLHNKNIIHRDGKPENIGVDKKKKYIKITDFGLSALIHRRDQILPDIAGTTDYLAPEVIKQTGYGGQSADIWSCGVIGYNCVTGNKPFIGSNSVMLNNIGTGNVEYPYGRMSDSLINLLKKIFDPNPETRYTIAQIMNDDWFKIGGEATKKGVEYFGSMNKEEDIENMDGNSKDKKDLQYIDTIYMNQKELIFDLDEIPLISGFELGMMGYGRAIGKMFSGVKGDFNEQKNFIFYSSQTVDNFCLMLKSHFIVQRIGIDFTKFDKDKVIMNLSYKDMRINIGIQMFKGSVEGKALYVFSYQSGAGKDYYKGMKVFFEKNKDVLEKV